MRTTARRALSRRAPAHPDSGLTLMEAVVASLLVGVLAAMVLGIIIQSQSAQIGNRGRIAAANLAAREIDLVRQEFMSPAAGPDAVASPALVVNGHPLTGGTVGQPLEVDGVPYTVTRSVAWNPTGAGVSACDGGSLVNYPTLTVTVSVTWPNMGTIRPVVSHTALAPDKGEGVQSTSAFVAVKVVDSAGADHPGRAVTVTASGFTTTVLTDALGCAVVAVNPAAGGTAYQATMTDGGFVDIGGQPNPTKVVGTVVPGTLNNSVGFAYDRAATVILQVQGSGVGDADVAGGQATLVAAEYSGASGETLHSLTGVSTSVGGLWPTIYSGYFGAVAPSTTHSVEALPGGTVTLPIDFTPAAVTLTNLPAGTTSLVAVPAGSPSTCGGPGARTFAAAAPAATISLLPGDWKLFATGTSFSCSPGDPAGYQLGAGENGDMAWIAPSTVSLTGSIPAGAVWAIDKTLAGALATCPGPGAVGVAQDVSAARGGTAALVAGDWYLYVTDGAADGACQALAPGAISPFLLAPLEARTLNWPAHTTSVTITDIERVSWGNRPRVFLGSGGPGTTGYTCTSGGMTSATHTLYGLGQPSSDGGSLSHAAVPQGTWYVWGVDPGSSWNPRCRLAGTVIVGPASGPLSINYSTTGPGSVGP